LIKTEKNRAFAIISAIIILLQISACGGGKDITETFLPAMPEAPQNVYASRDYSDSVVIQWDESEGALGYHIYKCVIRHDETIPEDNSYAWITDNKAITDPHYKDPDVNPDKYYYYKITAYNEGGNSAFSDYATGYLMQGGELLFPPPSCPEATDGSFEDRVALTWQSVDIAESYIVYRARVTEGSSAPPAGSYVMIADNVCINAYEDTDAQPGNFYYYSISICNTVFGESKKSSADRGYAYVIQAPKQIIATEGDYRDMIIVSWTEVPEADTFNLYRADKPENGNMPEPEDYIIPAGAENIKGSRYEDNTITPDKRYIYKAASVKIDKESEKSLPAEGYADSEAPISPDAPLNTAASDGDHEDRISVSWSEVTNAVSYTVYRANAPDGGGLPSDSDYSLAASDITQKNYNDTDITAEVHYFFRISATNSYNLESMLSMPDEGHASIKPPEAPLGLSATDGESTRIKLTWDEPVPSDPDIRYNIYRSETGDWQKINSQPVSGFSYNDNTALMAIDYTYIITAVRLGVEGPESSTDSGWIGIPAPENVDAWSKSGGSTTIYVNCSPLTLRGDPVSGAVYRAEYKSLVSDTWRTVESSSLPVAIGGLKWGFWYNIKIKYAVNGRIGPTVTYDKKIFAE